MEDFYRYTVLFSCKDEGGVMIDHPLRPFELEIEAQMYLEGYVDAIINHTDEKSPDLVRGMFRISKIGEENVKETKNKKSDKPKPKKDNSTKAIS